MEYYKRGDLVMPEYGRSIQQMVDHALTITDRDERNRCAQTIIKVMGNMFPYLRDVEDFKHKLWDHLAMMSGYELDIDYPYEIVRKEPERVKPEPPRYYVANLKFRHYGRLVEDMIASAIKMEAGEQRDAFALAIANQMKKQFVTWNKEQVENAKIAEDLLEMSNGVLVVDPEKLLSVSVFNQKKDGGNTNFKKNKKNNKNKRN